MKKDFGKKSILYNSIAGLFLIGSLWFISCNKENFYEENEPEWLGENIYDYLKKDGNFHNFVKLIEDVGYVEVLSKTGSKTLLVANDLAFTRFYEQNNWNVSGYEELSLTQKKLILNFSLINNAFLIEMLANYYDGSLVIGRALRRSTGVSVLDSIPFEIGDELPNTTYWQSYKQKGLLLLKDDTDWPLVHFLQKPLANAGISDPDFKYIAGVERSGNDAHIFSNRVIQRDITCKNGYIHVLENVLIPPVNMAQFLRTNKKTKTFSNMMERFCAPYFSSQTLNYKLIHPGFSDSIFVKRYFANKGGTTVYPNGKTIVPELLLPFDPGWNSYATSSGLQADMAAIFAPSEDAMEKYFNAEDEEGAILKKRFGTWDNVPNDIIILLLKRHFRESLLESIPSSFGKMNDSENSPIPATIADIDSVYVGLNGVVYITNKVYPPDDFVSIYGPVLFSENTRIFNWTIIKNEFKFYLNSLINKYSLFVPTDEFFSKYVDPVAIGKDIPGALKFWYDTVSLTVKATVYRYNASTREVGDSVYTVINESFLKNRLLDLLNSHIVVGNVESGSSGYYLTKGGTILKVNGSDVNLKVQGGGNIERDEVVNVSEIKHQKNGNTYLIDKPIQMPLRSVYKVLSQTPEFSEFFNLCMGFPDPGTSKTKPAIFVKTASNFGIDYNVKFFNTYNYTVYVPTDSAIQKAIADGVILPWSKINAIGTQIAKDSAMRKLERFLRYHFQDNSVLIGGKVDTKIYQTATTRTSESSVTQFNTPVKKFYKLKVMNDGNNIKLNTENYSEANVLKGNGLYNILVRDYIFSNNPTAFKEINTTGTGADFYSSEITTASTAVIHQIDTILRFE